MTSINSQKKTTIYIDVDDEITSIIDKVLSAKSPIVAIVLPKRTVTLQSLVNMKLLKKSAESASKKIVLITTETPLLPIAGTAGIHVAASLQSKPNIPTVPRQIDGPIDAGELNEEDPIIDKSAPIGALASLSTKEPETIELDNNDTEITEKSTVVKEGISKKFKIPNFNSFRLRLFLGLGLLLVLIVGWYVLALVLPKAEIVVRTDTTASLAKVVFTASAKATQLDEATNIVPAKQTELKKIETEKVPATGQKDLGTRATGTVTLKNCSASVDPVTIPSGTGVSSGALTFITQEAVTLPKTQLNGLLQCETPTKEVSVTAKEAGDKYNVSARSYAVAGYSGVQATGSAMSGGTSKIVKVTSDQDVEAAKQKLLTKNQNVQNEVKLKLEQEGLLSLVDTFQASEPVYTPTPKVGDEASEVTVTQTITYNMLGVKQSDLEALLKKEVTEKIDTAKESIRGYGFEKALFRITERNKNGDIVLTLDCPVIIGPEIKEEDIKSAVAGKKKTQAIKAVSSGAGVKDVQVNLKPFYVASVPKNKSKIIIKLEQNDSGTRELNP